MGLYNHQIIFTYINILPYKYKLSAYSYMYIPSRYIYRIRIHISYSIFTLKRITRDSKAYYGAALPLENVKWT